MPKDTQKLIERLESLAGMLSMVNHAAHFYGSDLKGLESDLKEAVETLRELKPQGVRVPKPKGAPRERNQHLDALAIISGYKLSEVTPSAWSGLAKALSDLRSIDSNVSPQEIERRADIYRINWPGRELTATALVKWWGACGAIKRTQQPERQADNL